MQPHENDWCIFDEEQKSQHITFRWFLSPSFEMVSVWTILKDNKAREQAGTREIMQRIPDLAYEIPIRNFILRFRPRSSEFLSARYTEPLNLVT